MFKYFIPVIVFFVLAGFLVTGLYKDPTAVSSPLIGKPVPQFTLPKLWDNEIEFSESEFAGKVSLFNVWATWCLACRQEHPLLVELSNSKVVTVYGLNYKDEISEARRYLVEHGDPFEASAVDATGRVGIDWGVYGVPETFIIDKQGVIRHKHIGVITQNDVQLTLLPLIQQLHNESM